MINQELHMALARECLILNAALKDGVALTLTWRMVDLIVTEVYVIDHQTLQVHTRARIEPFILPIPRQASRLRFSRLQPQILGITCIPWVRPEKKEEEKKHDTRGLHHRTLGGNYTA